MDVPRVWSRRTRAIVALWVSAVAVLVLVIVFLPLINRIHVTPPLRAGEGSDREETETVDLSARPSMETMVARYEVLQKAVVTALDARFGPQHWHPIEGAGKLSRSGCGEDEDPTGTGESVGLPSLMFDGTYPRAVWHDVRDVVIEVGRQHGFTELMPHLDQPDALDFSARDAYGATFDFGMGKNTVLGGVSTNCHRWQHPPTPAESP